MVGEGGAETLRAWREGRSLAKRLAQGEGVARPEGGVARGVYAKRKAGGAELRYVRAGHGRQVPGDFARLVGGAEVP